MITGFKKIQMLSYTEEISTINYLSKIIKLLFPETSKQTFFNFSSFFCGDFSKQGNK